MNGHAWLGCYQSPYLPIPRSFPDGNPDSLSDSESYRIELESSTLYYERSDTNSMRVEADDNDYMLGVSGEEV
jgi:hypothetical protein